MHSEAEPLIQTEKTGELPFHPGVFRKTKIAGNLSMGTGSQYFLIVDLLLNQPFPARK
jgi:hypothetical protein